MEIHCHGPNIGNQLSIGNTVINVVQRALPAERFSFTFKIAVNGDDSIVLTINYNNLGLLPIDNLVIRIARALGAVAIILSDSANIFEIAGSPPTLRLRPGAMISRELDGTLVLVGKCSICAELIRSGVTVDLPYSYHIIGSNQDVEGDQEPIISVWMKPSTPIAKTTDRRQLSSCEIDAAVECGYSVGKQYQNTDKCEIGVHFEDNYTASDCCKVVSNNDTPWGCLAITPILARCQEKPGPITDNITIFFNTGAEYHDVDYIEYDIFGQRVRAEGELQIIYD